MTTETVTARLQTTLIQGIDAAAKEEQLGRSDVMRRFLVEGLSQWRIRKALEKYKEGRYSFGQAVHFAKVSVWEFTDLMKQHQVPLNLDVEDIQKEFKNAGWS